MELNKTIITKKHILPSLEILIFFSVMISGLNVVSPGVSWVRTSISMFSGEERNYSLIFTRNIRLFKCNKNIK